MVENPVSIRALHGMELTANVDGERQVLATFECNEWPDCETCGHIEERVRKT